MAEAAYMRAVQLSRLARSFPTPARVALDGVGEDPGTRSNFPDIAASLECVGHCNLELVLRFDL
jgi:hypothetical protein